MTKGTIIYIGGFVLPDINAAAHRVVNNAKAIRDSGYNVVFINRVYDNNVTDYGKKRTNYFGFECWEIATKKNKITAVKALVNILEIEEISDKYTDLKAIIAYNFPAIALQRLIKYCKKKNAKCIGDITEWYGLKGRTLFNMIAKGIDSTIRMRYTNNHMDGLIVISEYLENYYKKQKNVMCIPPLTDVNDKKWHLADKSKNNITKLIYAGTPSNEKERLDIIVKQVNMLSKKYPLSLDIVGIDENRFISMYKVGNEKYYDYKTDVVTFHGTLSHEQTINYVKESDFSLIIRDDNRVTKAGFPTKFVESITCGTPVIASDSSDLKKYIRDSINGYIVDINSFHEQMESILNGNKTAMVEQDTFNYKNFVKMFNNFLDKIIVS